MGSSLVARIEADHRDRRPDRPGCVRIALARLARQLTRPRPLVTRFTRGHAWLLRHSGGRIERSALLAGGMPVLSLTTVGRRTGRPRSTVVAYMRDGDRFVITAANLGQTRPPAWFFNLRASGSAVIEVEGQRVTVAARRAREADELWNRWLELLPAADAFRSIAGREIPVIVLDPVRE